MTSIAFLDQNAWVALARGAWDKTEYPREHISLTKVVDQIKSDAFIFPLTFANIYETIKINDPIRRNNMARTQALVSQGYVFRSRRRILAETLSIYLSSKFSIPHLSAERYWFLSDLWFEAAAEYSPEAYEFEISDGTIDIIRKNPAEALFDYLIFKDEKLRLEAVQAYSASSNELIQRIENRRALASGETMALKKRVYAAQLFLDELNFILEIGNRLGLKWQSIHDIAPSLARGIIAEVPILNAEREIVVRLESQLHQINENDLRDMASFTTVLPFADIVVAEKHFVSLARQSRLDRSLGVKLMTSIFDF